MHLIPAKAPGVLKSQNGAAWRAEAQEKNWLLDLMAEIENKSVGENQFSASKNGYFKKLVFFSFGLFTIINFSSFQKKRF